jgi:hypothetical protein
MTKHLGHVTLSGDRAGTYIIEEERPGRRLVIAPITCSSAEPAQSGARDATHEEFAAFEAAYGPFLAADGEG